jgi:hypothetical protein
VRSAGTDLADEAEAFLTGRLVAHLSAGGQPVPAWAQLEPPRPQLRGTLDAIVATDPASTIQVAQPSRGAMHGLEQMSVELALPAEAQPGRRQPADSPGPPPSARSPSA